MVSKLLKHYADEWEILYYKKPARVYKVNYTRLIEQTRATEKSDRFPEDARIKAYSRCNFWIIGQGKEQNFQVFGKHCIINNSK